MKLIHILPLTALSLAFVIPEEHVMNGVAIESHSSSAFVFDKLPSKENLLKVFESSISRVTESSSNALDKAISRLSETADSTIEKIGGSFFDAQSWLNSAADTLEGHHGPPGPSPPHGGHGHNGKHPHKGGKCHHHKPNQTVYQLIAGSKYTTKLAGLINEFEDLVHLLNGTTANFTIFAPTDKAFEKIPEHAPKPSKEILKEILAYHVSPDFYPASRVLMTQTIPTLFKEETLQGGPQRLSTNIGLRGLTVNFYSRIIAIDILGTNGVIHGVDSILLPPPKAAQIISFLPGEFSTLELALVKTGLYPYINDTSNHVGGTFFAPSNFAFQRLGHRITGFLFSKYGLRYLTALLKYHVVANQTLYSDAFYKGESVETTEIPKGFFHVDLPTLLKDRSLSVDVARFGRLITIKINGFTSVSIPNGIAKDGVVHLVSSVLIPPKQLSGGLQQWEGEELSEEDFKERFEPYAEQEEL